MALAFVSVNNAVGESAGNTTTAGTAAITPTMPASTVNGQTRVFVIQCHSGVAGTTPTNWTALFKDTVVGSGAVAASSGQRYMSCYYRDKDASWSAMPSFPLTSSTQLSHWIGAVAVNKTSAVGNIVFNTPTFTTPGSDFGTANTAHSAVTGSLTTHAGGFLIIGSVENDNVTSTGGTLTQTGATFGTITERCDGGTATGNDVAGKVHTTSVTTGATAALTFAMTLSLASQGGTIVIEQTESTLAKADTLTDEFVTLDTTTKWDTFGAPAAFYGLRITPNSSYDYVRSKTSYDLTGSSVSVACTNRPLVGNGTSQAILTARVDANNLAEIFTVSSSLRFRERVASVDNDISITYDPVAHRYWRIRESGGTTFWDTSSDGTTWTNRRSKVSAIAMTAVQINIAAGYFGTESAPGMAEFEKLNVYTPVAKAATLTDLFSTQDTAKWNYQANARATGGRLELDTLNTYNGYVFTKDPIDLTGSSLVIKASSLPAAGNGGIYSMVQLFPALFIPNGSRVEFAHNNNVLNFNEKLEPTDSNVQVAYNSTNHKWWRIRESGGTVYWDTSPDAVTWTNQRSKTAAIPLDRVRVYIASGWSGSETNTNAYFDSVNGASSLLTDKFTTVDFDSIGPGAKTTTPNAGVSITHPSISKSDTGTLLIVGIVMARTTISSVGNFTVTCDGVAMTSKSTWTGNSGDYIRSFYTQNPGTGPHTIAVSADSTDWTHMIANTAVYQNVNFPLAGSVGSNTGSVNVSSNPGDRPFTIHVGLPQPTSASHTERFRDGSNSFNWMLWQDSNPANTSTYAMSIAGSTTRASSLVLDLAVADPPGNPGARWALTSNATFVNDQAVLAVSLGGGNEDITSTDTYDLTNSSVSMQAVQYPLAGGFDNLRMRLQIDSTNYVSIEWYGPDQKLYFAQKVANVNSEIGVVTTDKWWRIRESGGTVFWDTSADGAVWTNRRSLAAGIDLTNLAVSVQSTYWNAQASPGTAIIDNLNIFPPTSSLTDDFSTQDTAKWNFLNGAAATGGIASIPATAVYPTIVSNAKYDLTGSSVYVALNSRPNVGNGSTEAVLGVRPDTATNANQAAFIVSGSNLIMRETVASTSSDTSVTYDAIAHKYWRLRESGGTIFWDTSPDSSTWTNRRSKVSTLDVSTVGVLIQAGYWGTEPSPGTAIFDHFNLSVPPASSLTDDFTTEDTVKWTGYAQSNIAASGGTLNITPVTGGPDFFSANSYDLTGSSVFVKVVQIPNVGDGTTDMVFGVRYPADNANRFYFVLKDDGKLYFFEKVANVNSLTSITYNAVNHKWLRVRESGGTIYWDTSPDSITWTNQRNKAAGLDYSSVQVLMLGNIGGTNASPGTAKYDHLNLFVPSTSSLTDDFTTQDTAKWTFTGAASVTGGQLVLPVNASYADKALSVVSYDLTGSAIYVQLVQTPNLGNGTTEAHMQLRLDGSNIVSMLYSGGLLYMREVAAGVTDATSVTYDLVNHKWWRIRESGGTVYWDTSPDGVSWTNQRSKVAGIDLTALVVQLSTGYYGTEPSPGTAKFDNVNIPGVAASNTGQFFVMF